MIKVLLADRQPLTALAIHHLFEKDDVVSLVGSVVDKERFGEMLKAHRPELLIADHNLPGYLDKQDIVEVQALSPQTNILILSSDREKSSILEIVRSGIKGYVTKECSLDEITTAVKTIAGGGKFFCQKVLDIILENSLNPEPEIKKGKSPLSERELELLRLLAKGYSTHRAAEALNLSPHTIHSHRKNIIRKLNIKSPTQYVLYAIDLGLIKPS